MKNAKIIENCIQACADWGLIPTAFRQCMTWEEQVLWLAKFLQETVIPTVNENSEEVAELRAWFDNLDVQEEINNKLDQMAEDGTLQEIIASYLQSNVTWTFDTVADMKSATNLTAGSYARTLGFHSVNDGGGSTYRITDTGTADEMSVIAVGDLYANLCGATSELNVKAFGCYGDGEHDDTTALNAAILYAYQNNLTTFIPEGTYGISGAIVMYGANNGSEPSVTIRGNGRNNTLIKAIDTVTNMVEIAQYGTNTAASNMFIKDFGLDGNDNATNGIKFTCDYFNNSRMENIGITSCSGSGITPVRSGGNACLYLSQFIKFRVRNCGVGMDLLGSGNTSLRIADCYVLNCDTGYKVNGAYSTFENNCGDYMNDTVFYFNYFRGTILNPGAESPNATKVFEFHTSDATVINPYTLGNKENASAVHIALSDLSDVHFIGGKVLIIDGDVTGTAEGKLYQLGDNSRVTFDKTRYSSYKLKSTGRYYRNPMVNVDKYGLISNRYETRVSYIGKDTAETNGLTDEKNIEAATRANAIYFGMGTQYSTEANGESIAYTKHNMQGDIILSQKPAEIGGIGWIQAEDMTAEGAGTDWRHGTYLKIPVVHSGATADRPTTGMQVGQMYYDTTLNKPIWYKGSSVWVDATGTSV